MDQRSTAPQESANLGGNKNNTKPISSPETYCAKSQEMDYIEAYPSLAHLVKNFGVPLYTDVVKIPTIPRDPEKKITVHHLWQISPRMRLLAVTAYDGELVRVSRSKLNKKGIYVTIDSDSEANY
ncbi:hypothetical protein [Persicirhabdus sediminis]|uniref:Uncharacterized protein n=1 Tax=Persicirhabdus sediminis TaxID=454144 RepID=A0A8J7SJ65_9BACT|nr:hypothetical protein [Persicirhabdus sediminis]MBK1789985.1 hypothetical protein [Persicirhabdus sediminis]